MKIEQKQLTNSLKLYLDAMEQLPHSDRFYSLFLQHEALPLENSAEKIKLLFADNPPTTLLDDLKFATNKQIHYEICSSAHWHFLHRFFVQKNKEDCQDRKFNFSVDQYLEHLLEECLRLQASDIHLEAQKSTYRIRLRVDGAMHFLETIPENLSQRLVMKIKLLAALDISESRLPQDGQLQLSRQEHFYSFRLSCIPTLHGEKLALRLINAPFNPSALTQLNFTTLQRRYLEPKLAYCRGLILVCGPTGSGKTTTLYSFLREMNDHQRHILTAENPIEHHLEGINQVEVNPLIGLDFPQVLRAFLRQDPDVLMVGEVRDEITADIMIKAAQTGHLVLATLHALNTQTTLNRLQQLKVSKEALQECLQIVIAQRLLPKLCAFCRSKTDSTLVSLKTKELQDSYYQRNPEGCPKCHRGYQGRLALYEVYDFPQQNFVDQTLSDQGWHYVVDGTIDVSNWRAL